MGKSAVDGRKLPEGISQRKNGLYMARVMRGGKTVTIYNRSLTALKQELTDIRSSMQHGVYIEEDKTRLDNWFDRWMNDYCRPAKKKATSDTYTNVWDAQIRDTALGKTRLCDLKSEDIQEYLNNLSEDYASGYIHLIKTTLSQPITAAYKLKKIPHNLMDFIIEPKGVEKEERIALTKEQQDIFKKYASGSYLETFYLTALYTGMRSGELRGLKWSDITDKNITVSRTLHEEKGGSFREDTPKTDAGKRTIPIIPQLDNVLKRQRAYYNQIHNVVPIGKDTKSDYVFFSTEDDKPVMIQPMRRELQRIIDTIHADGFDFPDTLRLHELRHTFCSNCAVAGMPPKVLQKIMGHTNISVTLDVYTHIEEQVKQEEMEKIAISF